MNSDNLNFISNNVKGIQSSKKRIKIFEYLKNLIKPSGIIFMQETHSSEKDEKTWCDEFQGQLFFSHGKTNSCGVAIGFYGAKSFTFINKLQDQNGRILLIEGKFDDDTLLLINLYNANTESEQLITLSELSKMLENITDLSDKKIVFCGDFNVIFEPTLEAYGGNPSLKKQSLAKLIQIKEKLDLCDIWRIRNPKKKRYTFRQHHTTGIIHRRLDYFFISNVMQESIKKTDILASFSTDHSPIFFSLRSSNEMLRGKGLWKFNCSLLANNDFISKMRDHIENTLKMLDDENISDKQIRWEYLKFEIRKLSIEFSKETAKKEKLETMFLENKLKVLESNLNYLQNPEYIEHKNNLENIYQKKVNGLRIRSKSEWYEHGEKSSKFFLNLEKSRAAQSQIRHLLSNGKETTDQKEILQELYSFYKELFTQNHQSSKNGIMNYLNKIEIPHLNKEQSLECELPLLESEFLNALKSMQNNKSPGNDGLTKEIYEAFWEDLKNPLIASLKYALTKGELSASQKQAVIKFPEKKKDKDKQLIQNCRPLSLLNVDVKLLSKVLATRLKKVLPYLIATSQTAYVDGRFM